MRTSRSKIDRLPAAALEHRVDAFRSECRRRGLRVTPQRLAVYRALAADLTHPTAEAVWRRLRPELPSLSPATVYRVLESLEKELLVRRVSTTGSASRFDANVGPHQHLVCRVCGRMSDVSLPELTSEPVRHLGPESLGGFVVDGIDVRILGRCATCRAETTNPRGPGSGLASASQGGRNG